MMARPGQKASHQALARYCLPCATISPQVISGGWMPMPRKESALSASITKAKSRVAMVTSVGITIGRMWRKTMRKLEAPITCAACTNIRSRISSTSARVVRR